MKRAELQDLLGRADALEGAFGEGVRSTLEAALGLGVDPRIAALWSE